MSFPIIIWKLHVTPQHMSGLGAWFLMTREQRLLHEGPRQQKTCPKTHSQDKHVTSDIWQLED